MITKSQLFRKMMRFVSLSMAGALAAWFFLGVSDNLRSAKELPEAVKDSVIYPQLLSYQPLIEMDECAWLPASTVYAANQRSREEILAARSVATFPAVSGTTADADRAPRLIA